MTPHRLRGATVFISLRGPALEWCYVIKGLRLLQCSVYEFHGVHSLDVPVEAVLEVALEVLTVWTGEYLVGVDCLVLVHISLPRRRIRTEFAEEKETIS